MLLYLRWNYFLIPVLVFSTLWVGSFFTTIGIESGWYNTIYRPVWTPPGVAISGAWILIFTLFVFSALIVWNSMPRTKRFLSILYLFCLSAVLNMLWSYLFFVEHNLVLATLDAALLALSVAASIYLLWPSARWSALFLIPYLAWVIFATYLTYHTSLLN